MKLINEERTLISFKLKTRGRKALFKLSDNGCVFREDRVTKVHQDINSQ